MLVEKVAGSISSRNLWEMLFMVPSANTRPLVSSIPARSSNSHISTYSPATAPYSWRRRLHDRRPVNTAGWVSLKRRNSWRAGSNWSAFSARTT